MKSNATVGNYTYVNDQMWMCRKDDCKFSGHWRSGGHPHARKHCQATGHATMVRQVTEYYYGKDD